MFTVSTGFSGTWPEKYYYYHLFVFRYFRYYLRLLKSYFEIKVRSQHYDVLFISYLICRSVCSPTSKCNENKGHCSSDEDCKDGLKCGRKNCIRNKSRNCCYRPDGKHTPFTFYFKNDKKELIPLRKIYFSISKDVYFSLTYSIVTSKTRIAKEEEIFLF